ncbi:hypothetical protein SARC_01266 [Sphaeroforma arctica JP610]|uniref:Uncharacterized protein n=1 Tax=Sphaeroforma arctica JP610 TaxID=667725 RepID=A0A0L0GC76_9EUKA|nr:hypothetical protein SARC_01266 [Sphaeroforma arctica JP610]KNC86585.1 hypothetical protein SARC_01266 [Sphaeroforma arctica JP610]|eukprot:XP_014160487.1 hypothetical protein SARC_01266 [Sphaeroforma arctica JP610]
MAETDAIFGGDDLPRSSRFDSFILGGEQLWSAESKQEKMINYAMLIAFCVCAALLGTCAWLGGHLFRNLLLALPLVGSTVSHIILLKWYRMGELDPQVKQVLVIEAVLFLVITLASLLMFFTHDDCHVWPDCRLQPGSECLDMRTMNCVPCASAR